MKWLIVVLALACAWFVPWPAHAAGVYFTAKWDSSTSASISWHQTSRACLSVRHATGERVFLGCWEKWPQTVVYPLGGPGTDGAYRPQSGDVYEIFTNGQVYRTPLVGRPVYLPLVR